MSSTLTRTTRLAGPRAPGGEIRLQPPPELVPHEGSGIALLTALPMLGSAGSIVFVATTSPGPRGFIASGMFLLASLGFVAATLGRQRSQRQTTMVSKRREYLRYLRSVRRSAREAARDQRAAATWQHPEPRHLAALAEERSRVWERTASDPDFLHVRYGRADQALSLTLVPPDSAPPEQLDPVAATALHRLLATHRVQPELPAALDLRAFARIETTGPPEAARALLRAMVCSAVAFHSPDELRIAVLAAPAVHDRWDWLKWLPHVGSPTRTDGTGPARMVATSVDDLLDLLPPDVESRPRFARGVETRPLPHLLVVVDGVAVPPGNPVLTEDGVLGVTVLDLTGPRGDLDDTRLRLALADADDGAGDPADPSAGVPLEALRQRAAPVAATGDQLSLADAEAVARRLAPLHVGGLARRGDALAESAELPALLGLADLTADSAPKEIETAWSGRTARDLLRVPIGVGADGNPVHLDIKEAAQQGMGPHGLVVGATGSGKSELLRTLVLGLALTHDPSVLNLVLVDFKGGATFAGMAELPHVSALITNLEQELPLVDRMQDALNGEMVRRQETLRAAGNLASLVDYDRARAGGAQLPPLPSLFVVVDEFSEMLAAKPEFIDLFNAIGRLGRSLGVHLLLASQRLEEGRLRGLDSHLSYRIGLRTFSSGESRAVLGVPDAAELPSVPGLAFLKPDPSTLIRFKTAYVSGPPTPTGRPDPDASSAGTEVLPFTLTPVAAPSPAAPDRAVLEAPSTGYDADAVAADERSVLALGVDLLAGRGPAAHQVWLPPLEDALPLDALLGDLTRDPHHGLTSRRWRSAPPLSVPVGLVDRPLEQRRDTLVVDLAGAGGHVAVVGAPRSGKSTAARTLLAALALRHTPQEVQFYVLDFGGGTFAGLTGLPHVSGVATRREPDVVRRMLAEVSGIVDSRESFFRAKGIDTIETYRARRAAGARDGSGPHDALDDGYGDVFLVIDGWSTLRAEFEDAELELQQLAGRALTYGVHLVATASRWADFRTAVRDLFGTRLELRLGDPLDSEVDRKLAQNVPARRPGRGLVASKHHALIALPRVDGSADTSALGGGVEDLVHQAADAWSGPPAPRLRLLPDVLPVDELRRLASATAADEAAAGDRRLLLGVDERALAPVGLDVDADPHLLVFGDGGSGKSALLRTYAAEVCRTRDPGQAQLVLLDYRRALLGEVPEEYLLHYLANGAQAGPALADLAGYLRGRIPGPDVTAAQLRRREWWTGAEVFVLVDDYDLVTTSAGSPLTPLLDLLPQARDVGLHLVLCRRSGGAARALFEPAVQSLRDLSSPTLLLSGNREEGPLAGSVRPRPLAPGRGQLVTRSRGLEVVQTAWSEPTA